MRIARPIFAGLAWLLVAMVVVQVFWAGMALFAGGDFAIHREFGYLLSVSPILVLVAAWPARAGRGTLLFVAALLIVTPVQTILPVLRTDLPIVAALHPPTALLVFWMALTVARRATALARTADERTADSGIETAGRSG
jgi:hypothetical protein